MLAISFVYVRPSSIASSLSCLVVSADVDGGMVSCGDGGVDVGADIGVGVVKLKTLKCETQRHTNYNMYILYNILYRLYSVYNI